MSDVAKVIDIAEKIAAKAEGVLHGIEREMIVMKWEPEFRAILWETIAAIATQRAQGAHPVSTSGSRDNG